MQFVILIILTNNYNQSNYGLYQYAFNIAMLLSLFLQFVDEKVIKNLVLNKNRIKVLHSAIILKLLIGITILSVLLFLGFATLYYEDIILMLVVFIIANLFTSISLSILVPFDLNLESKRRCSAMVVGHIVTLTFVCLLAFFNVPLMWVSVSWVIGTLSTLIFATILVSKKFYKINLFKIDKYMRHILFKSIPLALATSAYILYMRMDLIMVEYFIDMRAVATYSVSMHFMSLCILLVYPLQVSLFPILEKSKNISFKNYHQIYMISSTLGSYIGIFVALLAIVLIRPIVSLLLGEMYEDITVFFYLHMITIVFIYNSIMRSTYITLENAGINLLFIQLIVLMFNFIFNYIFIPRMGLEGAALATTLSTILSLFISNLFFPKLHKLFFLHIHALSPLNIPKIHIYLKVDR